MMGVIPAWRLQWLLTEHGPVVNKRRSIEEEIKNKAIPPAALPTMADREAHRDQSSPPATDENPSQR
jgi:hypothetical protein